MMHYCFPIPHDGLDFLKGQAAMQGPHTKQCHLARSFGGWATSVGMLGIALQLGSQKLYPVSALQRFLHKAAFPMYVLHQVVVVSLAEFLIFGLASPVVVKLAVLTSCTLLSTAGLYQLTCSLPLFPQVVYGVPFKS